MTRFQPNIRDYFETDVSVDCGKSDDSVMS